MSPLSDWDAQMLFWGWAITTPRRGRLWPRPDPAVLTCERSGLDATALGLWDRDAKWLATTQLWDRTGRKPSPERWCLAGATPMRWEMPA